MKKKNHINVFVKSAFLAIILLVLLLPKAGFAATASAGDAGGGGITLQSTGNVTVTSAVPQLVKQARNVSGAVISNGSDVSSGQVIYFVVYVDNSTLALASDFRITDQLNEAEFTYIPDSLELATVATGSNDAAIWAGTWTPLTDSLGAPDDVASVTDSGGPVGLDQITLGAVPAQSNQILDVPASSLKAIRFRVSVN